MRKYKEKDYLYNLLLAAYVIFIVLLVTRFTNLYGSTTDWESQHYYLPDYFRTLFYSDGDFAPDFAMGLGGGQNIYNFSYYGLLNPIIIISYFLPFIDMRMYIMGTSIFSVILSAWIFYRWIFQKYGTRVAFFSSFLFVSAGPLIFHSHRHVMFINYMPFMIMALMGVERYFRKKKRGLLIISCTFMILCSYFFSVAGLIAVTLYAIGEFINTYEKITLKLFFRDAFKFALNIINSILISGVLLLPTAYTLLNGRSESNSENSIIWMLIPDFNYDLGLYKTYSMGLSAIFIVALIFGMVSNNKKFRFLSLVFSLLLFFEIFVYFLNGAMYIDGKVLIPFIPVGCYLIAHMLRNLIDGKYDMKKFLKWLFLGNILVLSTFSSRLVVVYMLDLAVCIISIIYYDKKKKFRYLAINTMLVAAGICLTVNLSDEMVKINSDYLANEESQSKTVNKILVNESGDYRIGNMISPLATLNAVYDEKQYTTTLYSSVYNQDFNNFFYNEICNENPYRNSAIMSQPNNLIYNLYMGNRFLINTKLDIKGYENVPYSDGIIKTYENSEAKPLGYASTKTLNTKAYEKLSYPYNLLALYSYIITDESENDVAVLPNVEKIIIKELTEYNDEFITKINDDKYKVSYLLEKRQADRMHKEIRIPVPEEYQDKILFVKVDVDNSAYDNEESAEEVKGYHSKDVIISVNGIRNKLTNPSWRYYNNNTSFEYTIASNEKLDFLDILFYDGEYIISDFEIYAVDYQEIIESDDSDDKFILNEFQNNNIFSGRIKCTEDGFFSISIPYDEGFVVKVDGKEKDYVMTDKAFIGFELEKGEHDIVFEYYSPLKKEGKAVSVIGVVLFIMLLLYDWRKVFVIKRRQSEEKDGDSFSDSTML